MHPDRWKEIEALFFSALEHQDRAAFLDDMCRDDVVLRQQVERLLEHEFATTVVAERLAGRADAALISSRRTRLSPGDQFGAYTIVEWLGSGGSGDVYKAADPRLDRYIALKIFVYPALTADDQARFVQEARAAASLSHPNIATIYEVGEAGGSCYISMEYIDGVTLRQKMTDSSCQLPERLGYLLQAARALERAHDCGTVHCDLKPENIMVTRDGLVKILDFGLARLVEGYRRERVSVLPSVAMQPFVNARQPRVEGTLGYMSPEQVQGRALDARTDVFSFGCILFEAATNRLPFWHESVMRSLLSLVSEPAPRLKDVSSNLPAGLQAILDGCLDKDPARRWEGIGPVRQRLEGLLEVPSASRQRSWWRVAGAAAVVAGLAYWQWPTASTTASIAVIPFANARGTADGAILADGISDGLISALAQIPDIKVIARTSSFRFKKDTLDVQQAARSLGVRTLVTGEVVEADGRLKITANLIDGDNGQAIWNAEYSPALADVADAQRQISREIARRLRSDLTDADERRLASATAAKPDAYALLLRGRYQMWLYNPESTQKAASFFEQALGVDPGFALAHAELANTYRRMGGAGLMNPSEALPMAEKAARRAIAADDQLAAAHAVLADIERDQWRWAASERGYRRALDLSSSLATARQGLAIGLSVMGRDEEAVAEAIKARELNPIGLSSAIDAAAVFYNVRRYDKALETLEAATRIDGSAPAIWTWIGIVNGGRGQFAQAIAAFDNAARFGDSTAATLCYYAHALARSGQRPQALTVLDRIRNGGFVPPSSLAIAYVGLDQNDRAFELLESAHAARDPLLQYIVVESHFDSVREDPRFRELVAKLGLPRRR